MYRLLDYHQLPGFRLDLLQNGQVLGQSSLCLPLPAWRPGPTGEPRPKSWQRTAFRLGETMERVYFSLGAMSGFLAVGAGAFAAHALRSRLNSESLAIFETAARYQMYHAVALCLAAWALTRWPGWAPVWAGRLFLLGTVLFSGSLYALALSGIRWLGAITPLGGVAFLAGWICLALAPQTA
jgi:uncharacterized membrane protein YgdD (TMEM256/DUF423 family)